uniref:H15 domain-containing protein n=1 Tax=Caenorhabditis tropicalis TaxID=1561998 RepID=A0A1I7TLK9_9PELO
MKPIKNPDERDHATNPAAVVFNLCDVWSYFNVVPQPEDSKWRTIDEIVKMFIEDNVMTMEQLREPICWIEILNIANTDLVQKMTQVLSETLKNSAVSAASTTGVVQKSGLAAGSPISPRNGSLTSASTSVSSYLKHLSKSGLLTCTTRASKSRGKSWKYKTAVIPPAEKSSTPPTTGISAVKPTEVSSQDTPNSPNNISTGSTPSIFPTQQQLLESSDWEKIAEVYTTAVEIQIDKLLPNLDLPLSKANPVVMFLINYGVKLILDENPYSSEEMVKPETWIEMFGNAREMVKKCLAILLIEKCQPKQNTEDETKPKAKRVRKRNSVQPVSGKLKRNRRKNE